MTKILKKSLACLLVFALCFTAIASCLAVSAAAPAMSAGLDLYVERPSNPNHTNPEVCEGERIRLQLGLGDLVKGTTMGISILMPEGVELSDLDISGWAPSPAGLQIVSKHLDTETRWFKMVVNVTSDGDWNYFIRFVVDESIPKNVVYGVYAIVEAATSSEAGDDNIFYKQTINRPMRVMLNHNETEIAGKDATCEEAGLTAGSKCTRCEKVLVEQEEIEALGHNFVDGKCDVCGIADPNAPTCDHADAVATVKTQPTKDAEGVMTYTCACGETWEESIAKPEVSTVYTKLSVNIESVVGTVIDVSYKQVKAAYGDDATYFISIDHEKFSTESATAFMMGTTNTVLPMSNTSTAITANLHKHVFAGLALYEMTLKLDPIVYIMNGDGVVVAYKEAGETSIAGIVTAEADSGKSSATLLRLYADMCNYGTALQEYFATKNPGSDICNQTLPTVVFKDHMGNASDPATMPATSHFNTIRNANKKVVSTTGFVSASPIMNVSASNEIKYTVRYDFYDWEDVEIVVSYTDSISGEKSFVLQQSELIPNGVASGNGQPKYDYFFKALPIYDYNKTVTMKMYYKGDYECYTEYSLGYYVVNYLNDASMTDVLTTMVLFAESTRDSLPSIQD